MHPHQLETARATLQPLKPLHWLYVKKGVGSVVATYAVSAGDDGNNVVFYRSVDLKTGETVDTGHRKEVFQAKDALLEHFSAEYVRNDGFALMQEFCADYSLYRPGTMPEHAVFGQCIYYASLTELHLNNDGFIAL